MLRVQAPSPVAACFVLWVAAKFGSKRLAGRLDPLGVVGTGEPLGLMIATEVDAPIDGSELGIGLSAGARQGALVTATLTLEMLLLGLCESQSNGRRILGLLLAALLAVGPWAARPC